MKINNVIKRPLITEKSTNLGGNNQYCFEVALTSSKGLVASTIENLFKVDVISVRTLVVPGKQKRVLKTKKYVKLPKWKKAIVTIKKGQTISLFETKEK